MSDKLDKSLNGGVEFVYGGKHNDSYYYFYDINGNETKSANEIVAKEIQSDNGQSYAIRVCGMKPAHHDSFKSSSTINPNFVKVDKDTFEDYVNYLTSKKEGSYRLVLQTMKAKGLI